MSRTGYFPGTSGSTYYAKPIPVIASPWDGDDIAGAESGSTGWFSFAGLDEAIPYAIYLQAGVSPADSDAFQSVIPEGQVDLVDAPNSTAVTAIQSGLSTFDSSSDEVTTDSASRVASRADVSGLATSVELSAVQAACLTVTTDQIRTAMSGRWTNVDTGSDYDDVTVGATP